MTFGSWTLHFDNYPNDNEYGQQVGVGGNVFDTKELGGAFWFDFVAQGEVGARSRRCSCVTVSATSTSTSHCIPPQPPGDLPD